MVSLGILYHKITGPYWQLVRSNVAYLDFHLYVEKMHDKLKEWAEDASDLLQPIFCAV
jgi:hypothetical protein